MSRAASCIAVLVTMVAVAATSCDVSHESTVAEASVARLDTLRASTACPLEEELVAGGGEFVPHLVTRLRSDRQATRYAAARVLGAMDGEHIPYALLEETAAAKTLECYTQAGSVISSMFWQEHLSIRDDTQMEWSEDCEVILQHVLLQVQASDDSQWESHLHWAEGETLWIFGSSVRPGLELQCGSMPTVVARYPGREGFPDQAEGQAQLSVFMRLADLGESDWPTPTWTRLHGDRPSMVGWVIVNRCRVGRHGGGYESIWAKSGTEWSEVAIVAKHIQ